MLEVLANLEKRASNFFKNLLNVVLLICLINTGFSVFIYLQTVEINKAILKIEQTEKDLQILTKKKIDHRYFNLTKSLEEIHGIKINTKNGELKK